MDRLLYVPHGAQYSVEFYILIKKFIKPGSASTVEEHSLLKIFVQGDPVSILAVGDFFSDAILFQILHKCLAEPPT